MSINVPSRRPSFSAVFGMHCALLSLASGSAALAVAALIWWRLDTASRVARLSHEAEFLSAALGILLGCVGFACPRKVPHRIAIIALAVNILVLAFTLDNVLGLTAK